MTQVFADPAPRLDPRKFQDPLVTARGERRAHVALKALETCGSTPEPCAT